MATKTKPAKPPTKSRFSRHLPVRVLSKKQAPARGLRPKPTRERAPIPSTPPFAKPLEPQLLAPPLNGQGVNGDSPEPEAPSVPRDADLGLPNLKERSSYDADTAIKLYLREIG